MKFNLITIFFILGIFSANARPTVFAPDTLAIADSARHIQLQEVKVIAQENRSAATSSLIGNEAIRHVQPFSLADLMQLLPGGITPKVTFTDSRYFTLRHIGSTPHSNALGTGISIDGVRLSTNPDLQQQPGNSNNFLSPNASSGVDTREISADQIESVEVIRGIPSARYGDITSGMVVVHTRKDVRPYSANLRITPNIKSFSLGKGWQAGKDGALNLSAGYTRSNPNISGTYIYNLVSFQAGYNRRFNRSLRLESSVAGEISANPNPTENILQEGEYVKVERRAFRFHVTGEWTPDRKLLTSIGWKTSAGYARSVTETNRHNSSGYSVGSDATEENEQQGFFIPPQHWVYNHIESRPLTANATLYGSLHKSGNGWKSQMTLGLEWNSEGNNGPGKTQEIREPSLPTQNRYNFRDIPFIHHYAAYAEENFRFNRLLVEAGVRITGISVQGYSFRPVAEPRLNLRYTVVEPTNTGGLQSLQLRGGVGLLRKMPTLSYLFSEPQYKNFTSYRYRDDETGKQLAVVTTAVSRQTRAAQLELPQNFKAEAGILTQFSGFSLDITGFYEHLRRGFTSGTNIRPFSYRNYNTNNDKGLEPEYRDGEVYINGQPTGYTTDTTFIASSSTGNNLYEYKGGVEFVIRSGYIHALATTFVLDGAWMMQNTREQGFTPSYKPQMSGNKSYPMCGFYDNGASATRSQRLNTTLRAVTEIPALQLTTTIALQSVWIDRNRIIITDKPSNRYYMKDADGNIAEDATHAKYINPAFYMDTQGTIHRFTPELTDNPLFNNMAQQYFSRRFLANSYSPYFLLNLRVSKEFGNHLSVAFYANNFAGMNPKRYRASSDQYTLMNPPAFFGAELQIKL